MPAIMKSARAYNAEINDLAKAGFAALDNLKLPANEFARALDIMAQSGKEGRFELKDMAQYFPMLTASASALGMTGTTGVSRLSAALQIAMKGAGDASSAATNTANLMQKIISPETTKKFQKHGIDIRKELKKVQKDGGDVFEFIAGAVTRALGGDMSKLGDLFEDAQVQQFLRPLISNLNEYRAVRDKAFSARGVVDADYARRMGTFQAATKNFSAALEELRIRAGRVTLPGLTSFMQDLTGALDSLDKRVTILDKIKLAFEGLMKGLGFDGSSFMDGLRSLRDFLFGDAASFEEDMRGLTRTFESFKSAGESIRVFAASIEKLVTQLGALIGLDVSNSLSWLGTLAQYAVPLMAAAIGFRLAASSLMLLGRAIMFVSGASLALKAVGGLAALAGLVGKAAPAGAGAAGAAAGAAGGAAARFGTASVARFLNPAEIAKMGAGLGGGGRIARLMSGAGPLGAIASVLGLAAGVSSGQMPLATEGAKANFDAQGLQARARSALDQATVVSGLGPNAPDRNARINEAVSSLQTLRSEMEAIERNPVKTLIQQEAIARAEALMRQAMDKLKAIGAEGVNIPLRPAPSAIFSPTNSPAAARPSGGAQTANVTVNVNGVGNAKEVADLAVARVRDSVQSALRESHRDVYSYG
jgi:TP901 family phage tail tape measure protein